ncbi:MAG: hypothetical protein WBN22_03385 [Verrucomicrobiia bacterium]
MKPPEKLNRVLRVPKLTWLRMVLAISIAVIADGLQFLLGQFGWAFGDQMIDVVAMILTSWAVGFHWLLLPTFALEFIPVLDELPTWTACVIAVIALRKREQRPLPPETPVIEI